VILTHLKGISIGKPQTLLASTNGGRFTVAYIEPKSRTPSQTGQGSRSFQAKTINSALELLVELASGAGDVHSARHAAFSIFDTLHNASRLGALGTIRALGGVHLFFTVARFRNLCHDLSNLLLPDDPRRRVLAHLTSHHSLRLVEKRPINSNRR
jgi:hypothetical protein